MLADLGAHRQPAVGHRAHQVDAPARAVVLVARLDVGRAARGAEAAVDAVLEEPVVDLLREPVQVDPRRHGRDGSGSGWSPSRSDVRASRSPCWRPSSVGCVGIRRGVARFDTSDCTDKPPRIHHPFGVERRFTRSARPQSGRGSPQTRSRSFHAVGHRGRIRLPPSRPASERRRSISGASVSSASSAPRAWPRTIPLPACAWTAHRAGSRPRTKGTTERRPQAGHEADRADLGRLELGQGRPERAGLRPRGSTSMRRPSSSAARRSSCQATDAALSSKPTASTQPSVGRPSPPPTSRAAERVQQLEGDRAGRPRC